MPSQSQTHASSLAHARPSFARLFGTHVAFTCDADEVVYPVSLARAPAVNADPYLNALLVKYCDEAMARRRKKSGDVAIES